MIAGVSLCDGRSHLPLPEPHSPLVRLRESALGNDLADAIEQLPDFNTCTSIRPVSLLGRRWGWAGAQNGQRKTRPSPDAVQLQGRMQLLIRRWRRCPGVAAVHRSSLAINTWSVMPLSGLIVYRGCHCKARHCLCPGEKIPRRGYTNRKRTEKNGTQRMVDEENAVLGPAFLPVAPLRS